MNKNSAAKEALFHDALLQPAAERGAFLARACGADDELRAELLALIGAHEGNDSLVSPVMSETLAVTPDNRPGDWIGRYRLLQQIGEGGCGVVWMAEQEEPVRRRVAVKVIKLGMDTRAVIARFEAERQALAMMDHPHIAKVHDAGSTAAGRPYFVMELVRGVPITRFCDESQLRPDARLELFIKVCRAIQHAHQKGIIHRDLKPSNILVTVNDGQPTPKVIDFGIAKATQGKLTDATLFTAFEQFIGTPAYMSPEQAEMSSVEIDTRADIYSLGVLLYELLTGRPPFDPKCFARAGVEQIRQLIRENEPPRPSARWQTLAEAEQTTMARQRGIVPTELSLLLRGDLDWIVMRCLEKDRNRRYETANGLVLDLERHLRNEPVLARPPSTAYLLQKLIRRHRVGFAAASVVLVVVVSGALVSAAQARRALRAELAQGELREAARQEQLKAAEAKLAAEAERQRHVRQRWAREQVLPEIGNRVEIADLQGAFQKASEVAELLRDDPEFARLWNRVSLEIQVESNPPGAEVLVLPYRETTGEWRSLGRTPLAGVRLARSGYRWRVQREGSATIERAHEPTSAVRFDLEPAKAVPAGMFRVTAWPGESRNASGPIRVAQEAAVESGPLGEYYLDRYEVTNRQYQAFVDAGGYTTEKWWTQPFRLDGRRLSWSEAMARLHDTTGRPGPATWRNGAFPPGEGDHPVGGVSWFEAVAYAEFVGKRLPSVRHWRWASMGYRLPQVAQQSNFLGYGTMPVGQSGGLCGSGAYDMAGNVREWCWNDTGQGKRYLLGGAFDEPSYQFTADDAAGPWERPRSAGFRCLQVLPGGVVPAEVDEPQISRERDLQRARPVADDTFRLYRELFAYDRTPLDVREEAPPVRDRLWRKEVVSIAAAYGSERVPVWIYLPPGVPPPYQAVVIFPGSGTLGKFPMTDGHELALKKLILESGRAFVFPTYRGTFLRHEGMDLPAYRSQASRYRDDVVCWSKDLGRTLDYLATRPDIRPGKIAFVGNSLGGQVGNVLVAVEPRICAAVYVNGGILNTEPLPQVDPVNFAPRISIPVLMVNGKHDFTFAVPVQRRLFELLGTPEAHKKHVVFETSHAMRIDLFGGEILAWLDRYLGPVR